MIFAAYRTLAMLAQPVLRLYLRRRLRAGKEDPARLPERRGVPGLARPDGPLLWVHAASVGESLSVLPLLTRLLAERPQWTALITSGTVTSAKLLETRLPPRAIHQFIPLDAPGWVSGFLDYWRPTAALWMESEFWPTLLYESRQRRLPMALVNGRMSDRSFRGWSRRAPGLIAEMLGTFSLCLAQTPEDARRLAALGAARSECLGNLKEAAPPLDADPAALEDLRAAVAARPLWLMASTHAGEEALALRVHQRLLPRHPGLLTVIVPRHADRGQAIAAELRGLGARVSVRSQAELPQPGDDVYLADTMGEMGLFYRLSPLTVMGKSFIGQGGQNPVEAARLGSVVLVGPHMDNFADMVERMAAQGAVQRTKGEDGLAASLDALLAAPQERALLSEAGQAFAGAEDAVLDRITDRLLPLLDGGFDARP